MSTPLGRRLAGIAARSPLPRRTVRLRLTVLYATLFLASGALVLAITYGLVDRATRDDPVTITLGNGATVSATPNGDVDGPGAGQTDVRSSTGGSGPVPSVPSHEELEELASEQHADRMHELLVQSGIALGVMAVVSAALGWIVAGRVLRPLRTITAAARDISEANLHRRLALEGPDDELKELGDTFDELLGRLERAFEAQRRFVANASHELRTPLTRQRTVAQIALDDHAATVESLRTAHERALAAGAEQERLIDALLTLARGQTGLDTRRPIDLAELTSDVLVTRRTEAQRRGLRLHEALTPAPTTGDPRLLERLVANLVDNALCHNEEDGACRRGNRNPLGASGAVRRQQRTGRAGGVRRPAVRTVRAARCQPSPPRRGPRPRALHRAGHRRSPRRHHRRPPAARGRPSHRRVVPLRRRLGGRTRARHQPPAA